MGKRIILITCLLLAFSFSAQAGEFKEEFSVQSGTAGWFFGTGNEVLETAGGNPDYYVHDSTLSSFGPSATMIGPSIFTGNFRFKRVSSLGIDLKMDMGSPNRPVTLFLITDRGTPNDNSDDFAAAYTHSGDVMNADGVWRSYDFQISVNGAIAAGWQVVPWGTNTTLTPADSWQYLSRNITTTAFLLQEPGYMYILDAWDMGLDNPRITMNVRADFNGDNCVTSADIAILRSHMTSLGQPQQGPIVIQPIGAPVRAFPSEEDDEVSIQPVGDPEALLEISADLDGDGDVDFIDLKIARTELGECY